MPDDFPAPPDSPPPRSTDGSFRWKPPDTAELQALMPGYTIEKLLGRGGMGAVYKGVQTNLDRPVAIKILPPGVEQEDPSFAERFRNEARLMAKLMNPTVVGVFDFGTTLGGQLYIAMEYVDGTDVAQMIRTQQRLQPEHALAITAHVCDALTAAHRLGIVHRDIKPANILINREGQVKVADFGLAKLDEADSRGLTKTGYAMGTPDFVAPEALMLGAAVDGRADLYAVGVMLYQMLTGEVPRGAFKPASVRIPGLDRRYDPIIMKAMQSDREERYQSSTELRQDLDVILTVPIEQAKPAPKSSTPAYGQTVVPQRSAVPPAARAAVTPPHEKAPAHPAKSSSTGMVVGLLAALAVIGGLFWLVLKPDAPEVPPNPFLAVDEPPTAKPASAEPAASTKPTAPAPTPPNPFLTADEKPVTVPAWLITARKMGGKTRFFGTGPSGITEKGRAEEFKDVVEVALRKDGWLVRRANGDTYGVGWSPPKDGSHVATAFGPFNVSRVSHSEATIMCLSGDGSYRNIWGGGSQSRTDLAHKDSAAVIGILDHLMALNADGKILMAMRWNGEKLSPPADFFQGASAFAGLGKSYIAARPGQPVAGWQVWEKKLTEFPAEIHQVVDMQAADKQVILLTVSGQVFVTDEFGRPVDKPVGKVPPSVGPAIAVRTGSGMCAAQMTDGTWVAWGDSAELIEQTKKIGPALDVGYHYEKGKSSFMLWVEGPAAQPAVVVLKATPTTPTTATVPDPPSSAPATPASALDQRLDALESGFQAAVERDAGMTFKAGMVALDKSYLAALDRSIATVSKGGKLEEAIILREERQRIEKGQAPPSEEEEVKQAVQPPATLKTLRQTYRGTAAQHEATKIKTIQQLYDKYDQALAALQLELTQANKLDEALRVKTLRKEVTAGRGTAPAGTGPAAASISAGKDKPFVNSLGMKFVPVPGAAVLMCMHETRRKDYSSYARDVRNVDNTWRNPLIQGKPLTQENDHPVVSVSWEDATAFCDWLSKKERRTYRLPDEHEWNLAVANDLKDPQSISPPDLTKMLASQYPWGTQPPEKCGNYRGPEDGYEGTAPVMSFLPNQHGIYDLGGNAWEWCRDGFTPGQKERIVRGCGYLNYGGFRMSDRRALISADFRATPVNDNDVRVPGFRCVLETGSTNTATKPAAPATPPPAAPAPAPATPLKGSPWRIAAEWVLSLRGTLYLSKDGQTSKVSSAVELPPGKFDIVIVSFSQYSAHDGLKMTDADLERLAPFAKTLTRLNLDKCNITGSGLAAITGAVNLQELTLAGSPVTDAELKRLASLRELTHLSLIDTKVDGTCLLQFQALKKLRNLSLSSPSLSAAGTTALEQLVQLEELHAGGANLSKPELKFTEHAGKLPNLRRLTFGEFANFTDADLPPLSALTKLEDFNMPNTTRITGTGLAHLKGSAATMKRVDLGYSCPVSDAGVQAIAAALPNLETLIIGRGGSCATAGLRSLAALKKLRSLNWQSQGLLADSDYALFAALPNLERLGLQDHKTTDAALSELIACKKLNSLDLTNTQTVTDAGIQPLKALKALRELSVRNTQVTDQGIGTFTKARPDVKVTK